MWPWNYKVLTIIFNKKLASVINAEFHLWYVCGTFGLKVNGGVLQVCIEDAFKNAKKEEDEQKQILMVTFAVMYNTWDLNANEGDENVKMHGSAARGVFFNMHAYS